ncbi:general substrate transporter [Bipolaris maydis]|uniref:general substrate transporter n=1 Tax=Cochliobolus heterostrophus TaxID=5016 RepID=UPI0024DBA4B5|nr:general substrate transporter [Bipolaris maydis]
MAKPSLLKDTVKAIKGCPPEIFNVWLFFCTAVWSFSVNIASIVVQNKFKTEFGVIYETDAEYANTKGWIVSIATAGAVFGCLACINLVQIWGRKWTMLVFTVIYIAGILGQTFSNGSLSALYATRFVTGIGIGTTTVLPSIYLTEIAPRSIRGLLTLQYACCQQLGVVFGFFFNYGITKYHAGTRLQWQLPTGLQLAPAVIWGIGILFTPESPRFLLSKSKSTEALQVLCRFRNLPADHPYIVAEFAGIEHQLNLEIEAWSGANAITQYSPSIFGYLGIEGEEARFLATDLYGIVKFVSILVFSIFVIDFIGRRRSLMLGISLQILTLTFVGAYLGVTNGMSAAEIEASASATAVSKASIVAIFIHAVAWSIGWFSIPYLVSAEVFPVRIRSLNVSILMAFHWAFYFGCSRAIPSPLSATDRYVRRVAYPNGDDLADGGARREEKLGEVLDEEKNGEVRIEKHVEKK